MYVQENGLLAFSSEDLAAAQEALHLTAEDKKVIDAFSDGMKRTFGADAAENLTHGLLIAVHAAVKEDQTRPLEKALSFCAFTAQGCAAMLPQNGSSDPIVASNLIVNAEAMLSPNSPAPRYVRAPLAAPVPAA